MNPVCCDNPKSCIQCSKSVLEQCIHKILLCKEWIVFRPSIVDRINYTLVELKLSLGTVTHKDNGTYRCMAYGPQGEVSRDVHLLVLGTYFYYCMYFNVTVEWVVSSFMFGRCQVLVLVRDYLFWTKLFVIPSVAPGSCCDSTVSLSRGGRSWLAPLCWAVPKLIQSSIAPILHRHPSSVLGGPAPQIGPWSCLSTSFAVHYSLLLPTVLCCCLWCY